MRRYSSNICGLFGRWAGLFGEAKKVELPKLDDGHPNFSIGYVWGRSSVAPEPLGKFCA